MKLMSKVDQLSIGLITFGGSKYLDVKKEHHNFKSLFNELDITSNRVKIIDEDKHSQGEVNITFKEFTLGLTYYFASFILTQLRIIKYSRYATFMRPFYYILMSIIYAGWLSSNYALSRLSAKHLEKFQSYVVRQKNITNNHIEAMRQLLNTKTPFILVLEDDFLFEDIKQIKKDLNLVINKLNKIDSIKILNLSKSFTEKQLGINKNKIRVHDLANDKKNVINQYRYPVTNTACAILYRNEMCFYIIQELEKLNKFPFIPIDHKLNISLSKLIKKKQFSKSCYASVVPGLLIQGSLHA